MFHVPWYHSLLFHFPLSSVACSAWLCLSSIVWDVEKAARLLGEPAADCEYKTFDFTVAGCALRYLTAELPTQRPAWAAVTPDTMEHGKKRRRECPGKSRLTAGTSMYCAVRCPMGGPLRAHWPSLVLSAMCFFIQVITRSVVGVVWPRKWLSGSIFFFFVSVEFVQPNTEFICHLGSLWGCV